MKTNEFDFTAEEAQFLFERASGTTLPSEMGDEKFDMATQSIANNEMAVLFKNLRGYSPWAQAWGIERLSLFGDKNDWVVIKDGDKVVKADHLAPEKSYRVRLSKDGVNGAMWVLFLSLFPSVKIGKDESRQTKPVSNAVATQLCWPIAAKLGKTKALQSYLKINPSKARVWADDEQDEVPVPEAPAGK